MPHPFRQIPALLLLVVTLAPAMAQQRAPDADTSGGITEIVLERTACSGSCPVDTLVLRASGKAEYTGRRNTHLTGDFAAPIGKEDFDRLAQWMFS
jgi:hypothetical protein